VAVLDTGIVLHPQLTDRILPGYDFVSDSIYANDGHGRDNDPTDPGDWVSQADRENDPLRFPSSGASECPIERSSWHGTNIAGLLVATTNDATGTAGINWDGKVLPVRVAGKCGALVSDIIDGMRWAAGLTVSSVPVNPNPVRIINISFGGTGICEPYQSTIDELRALGVVLVAAGGNEQSAVTRPAKCPGVIGVGAVNRDGFKANYSNFGPELTVSTVGGDPQRKRDGSCDGRWGCILGDEGVLGLDIAGETTVTGVNQYAYLFGTSFSAPITAGAVSLMLSANPALTHQQILEGLRISARPHVVSTSGTMPLCSSMNYGRCICTASTCGAGLLDADEAVRYAEVLLAGAVFTPKTWPLANIDSPQLTQAAALGADEPDVVEGGGGGALQPAWLLALALLTLLMAFAPRARHAVRHTWR
jgi:serine protease